MVGGRAWHGGLARVLSERRTKAIEDVRPGDIVRAYDFDAGKVVPRKVLKVYRGQTYHLVDVCLGGETLSPTQYHRFWVENEAAWLDAIDLAPGMQVRLTDGRLLTVDSVNVRDLDNPEPTYNLEVDGAHNYFVGENGILVHNGPPLSTPGYWNYYLLDESGQIYYVGMAGPNATEESVRYRHSTKYPGRFNKVEDTLKRVPGTHNYGDARRFEHEKIVEHKTYIGRDGTNYRGNRQRGISTRNATRYYAKGKYPTCP